MQLDITERRQVWKDNEVRGGGQAWCVNNALPPPPPLYIGYDSHGLVSRIRKTFHNVIQHIPDLQAWFNPMWMQSWFK